MDSHYTGLTEGYTFYNWQDLFTGKLAKVNLWSPLLNSVLLSVFSCFGAIFYGGLFAYLVTRTNMRCKKYLSSIFIFPYIMPQWTLAVIWQNLFDSNLVTGTSDGLLAAIFGIRMPLWWCQGMFPSVMVLSLHYAPFAYILIGGIFRNMDANLEEAATILDTPKWKTMCKITLPMVKPAILSTILLVFGSSMGSYPVPHYLGLTTLSTKYVSLNSKYTGEASILAIIMMVFGVAIMLLNQMSLHSRKNYTTVTGKSGQISKINLGRVGKYIIALVLVVVTFFTSIFPIVSFAFETFLPNPGDYSFLYTGDTANLTTKWWITSENITENGMSCHDNISADGRVHDPNRITFLDSYIGAMQRASDEGADVRGYFLWTFLDNFEWSDGYKQRFGIIYVDFTTQQRIVKDSAFWYQKVIETNGGILSMNQANKDILFLDPVCTHNIWGGTKLREEFGYPVEGDDIGECWGISAHPNGDGTVRSGAFSGMKLSAVWKEHPEVFGNYDCDRFPLLTKIIDARDDLSIQVHPNDDYAKVHENGSFGKTECWYIMDAPEGATLVIGHNAKTKEELSDMIHQGRWKEFIREIPVKKGDFIQIDPGTVHAIKGGLLILETQQNSDITYRVYDYDRLSNGKPRELHVEKSIDVITVPAKSVDDSVKSALNLPENQLNELYSCKYYTIFKADVNGKMEFEQKYPFLLASVLEGDGIVGSSPVKKGDHFILPNGYGKVEMQGKMSLIVSTVK
mgnify:CR=1 FL=1